MFTRDDWRARCELELGKPYLWGAQGPDAYDCSGFAQWALSLLNLDPPGDQAADGLYRFFKRNRSTPVTNGQAELGDIVFFGTDDAVTHVGLAWGDGNMLEAGGGGRKTITVEIARQQHAEVRIRPITRRNDLVEILRPSALSWPLSTGAVLEAVTPSGHYDNSPPLVEWLEDGRHMRLKRPFGYVQESGRNWPVPTETVVDGASIPKVFWSLIGGPFEGRYRDASIVHDYYCDARTRSWQDTHRVFYEAMLCSGVATPQAKVMYYAVYRFGPRWTFGPAAAAPGFEAAVESLSVPTPLQVEPFEAATFEADASLIYATQPDIDAIEAMADARGGDATSLTAQADAAAARLPLLQRLVELQDAAVDGAAAEAVGALLSRFNSEARVMTSVGTLEAAPPFEVLKPQYEELYATCRIRLERKGEVDWYLKKLVQYRSRYEAVAQRTQAPWWFIAVVHALEASFNFNAHLHNGDPLTGRTVQVPKGRPPVWNPPNDWESSAIDAITYEKLAGLADWSVATALYRWERFNGFGYHSRNINSPYLWSFSTHYTKGKFVKDGVFDPDAVSNQCGAAVMLRGLEDAGVVHPG
ncbi:DUF1353 domain-containing protein [Cupriavidus necator]|uniref:DUF1353 domain-containing protein n=1 Tax=Cupriavidus necator TaxID=106590 RepID=UPI003F735EC4